MREEFKTTFNSVKAMEPNSLRYHVVFSSIKWLMEEHGLREKDSVGDMVGLLEDLCSEYDGRVQDNFELRV